MNKTISLLFHLTKAYLKPYIPKLCLGFFTMLLVAGSTASLAHLMQPVIDEIFIAKDTSVLLPICFSIFFIFMIKGLASYFESIIMAQVGEGIICDIRKSLYSKIISLDVHFFDQTHSSTLTSRFITDTNLLNNIFSRTISNLVKDFLTLIFLVTLMFYKDWFLASIAFIVFPLAIYPILRIGKSMRKTSYHIQESFAQLTHQLVQSFQGIRLVKSYLMETYEIARTHALSDHIFKMLLKKERVQAASHPIMEFLGGIAIVTVIAYGGYNVIHGDQTAGAFFSFITSLLFAYEPLKKLSNLNSQLQEKLAGAERIEDLKQRYPKIVSPKVPAPLTIPQGKITFENVHFGYTPKTSVLHNINCVVPGGKKVALVGPSGGGKTTLLNLILRFYDPTQGQICIDGTPIHSVDISELRRQTAFVSQEITLFHGTISDNIHFGNPQATQEDIKQAAQAAAAHDFIRHLPDGYLTQVGETGKKLSGGQRQRIAIARAILKNAPILLLDEATSALDSHSEDSIQNALKDLSTGRTTLTIAHRLSTVLDADLIYFIDQGQVKAAGSHSELLETSKDYSDLCRAQFKRHI